MYRITLYPDRNMVYVETWDEALAYVEALDPVIGYAISRVQ